MDSLLELDIYARWKDGDTGPMEALRALCSDLGEVESDIKPLEAQRDRLRDKIGDIVARQDGQRVEVRGFGRLMITAPGITEGYDGKALDALVAELRDDGNEAMAERILALKGKKMRAGGLRIEREKPRATGE